MITWFYPCFTDRRQPETMLPPTENGASAPGVNGYAAPLPGDLMSSATGAAGALAGWAMSSIGRKVGASPPTRTSTILICYSGAAHDTRPHHHDRLDTSPRYTFIWTRHIGPIRCPQYHPRLLRFHVGGARPSPTGVHCPGSGHRVQTWCNKGQGSGTWCEEGDLGRCTCGGDGG